MKNNKITNRPLVLISVMLAMFVGAVEATIVTTAMPAIASDLGGFSRYSWIFSSYLLMSTVTVLIYGKLADLFGRKPILFIGLTIFLIGSILCGFAVSMEQLIVFRLLQGLGAGAVMPIATTIVGDIYTTEERAKVQGYLSSVWGISAVSGPVIGGLIVHYMNWKFVFWVNVPLGILAMVGIYLFLHEPKREKKVSIDYKGAFLLTLSLSTILFWLVEGGQAFGRISFYGITLIIVGLGSLALFVRVERRAIDPVMPFAMWKNPVILYANLVSLTTGVILIGVSSYLPTFVTGVMEQPAIIAGFTLDRNVHWLADCILCCRAFVNPLWNVSRILCGWGITRSWNHFICHDGCWIRTVVGCDGKLFCGRRDGADKYIVHRHNPRGGSKRDAGIRDGCQYVHAEFWEHGRGGIIRRDFKWHVNGSF